MSKQQNVLIIDNDKNFVSELCHSLNTIGIENSIANSLQLALELLDRQRPEIIISVDDIDGQALEDIILKVSHVTPDVPLLILGGDENASYTAKQAVSAIRHGAYDYLIKSQDSADILNRIKQCIKNKTANLIAEDPQSRQLLSLSRKVAKQNVSVLVSGASGTGKEVIARYIHDNSQRAEKPFIAVNCAAIPEQMLEATLFGYEKGAFTGAHRSHSGKFEQANSGTLLLDEISEMALPLQAKLLRILQERELERLGSTKTIQLDVRIIATTNRDLTHEISENRFREDLYYRLNIFPLHWLPLKERPLDIIPLAQYLLAKHAAEHNRITPELLPDAQKKLLDYHWPGNAREMENILQRALILQESDEINADNIQLEAATAENKTLSVDMKQHEYHLILQTLETTQGNRKQAALLLNISPRTLRYKMARMREAGIEIPSARQNGIISITELE